MEGWKKCGRLVGTILPWHGVKTRSWCQVMTKKQTSIRKSKIHDSVFPALGEGCGYVWLQSRILHAKLYALPAAKVWGSRLWSKHAETNSFMLFSTYRSLKARPYQLIWRSYKSPGDSQSSSCSTIVSNHYCEPTRTLKSVVRPQFR